MNKYIIERNIPGAGNLTPEQLKAVSQKSCAALEKLGTTVQWVQSLVTADKVYCTYLATGPEAILRHAELSGIPAHQITPVRTVIDPITAVA